MDAFLIRKGYRQKRTNSEKSTFGYIIVDLIVRESYEEKEGIYNNKLGIINRRRITEVKLCFSTMGHQKYQSNKAQKIFFT